VNRPGISVASRSLQEPIALPAAGYSAWRDWVTLAKPEITFLVTITAAAGFLLGSPDGVAWGRFLATLVGVALASAGGATLNHVYEHPLDALMRRTAARPLPGGRIAPTSATWFGLALVAAGLGLLCPLANPLTGVLAAITVILYVLVYTPLKRRTTLNTIVGTIPGALPALGGWTAATGNLAAPGWILFAVLVFWQIPHFLALAWMYRGDYARAEFRMLPVVAPGGRSTAIHVVVASALMIVASLLPFVAGIAGPVYAFGAAAAGIAFVRPVAAFSRTLDNAGARRLLRATVYYIPLLLALVIVDRLAGL
jgi:protoheme IX farnesyltransferase